MPTYVDQDKAFMLAKAALKPIENGEPGLTWDAETNLDVGKIPLWSVGIRGREMRLNQFPNLFVLFAFVLLNTDLLFVKHRHRYYFGAWYCVDEQCWYLDVVRLFDDVEDALAFGEANDQKVIYNLETGESRPCRKQKAA